MILWLIYLLVRFLALVTTMVTKVDHSNHRGYYDSYYDGNTFFVEENIFLDDFLRFWIIFDSFHTKVIRYGKILGNKWRNHALPM